MSPHDAQEPTAGPLSVFFSYCHRDEELRGELGRHLKLLERVGLIKGWHDREIAAGDEWAAEINVHLYTADLLLLLLSSDFFASDYCEIEAAIALERHNANAARAIPVVLRPVVWRQSPLSVLQALPKDGRPVVEWPSSDLAFVNVCEGILNSVLSWRNETRSANVPRTQELRRFSSRRRMLDVAMPAEVEIGKSVMLVVLVRKALSAGLRALLSGDVSYGVEPRDVHSKAVLLRFPIGQTNKPESISLTVLLRTPDFDPPEQKRSLTLQPDEDSQPLIFILAPKRAGALKAVVEIYYKDELVTSCPLSTLAAVAQVLKLASPNIASATFDVGGAELDAKTQQALQLLEQHRMTDAMAVVNLALREFPDAVELHAIREMVAVALENQRWQAQDEKRQRDEEESFARGKTEALERPMALPSAPAPSGRRSRLPFVLLGLACLLLAVVLFLLLR